MADERFRLGAPPVGRITALLGVVLFMLLASMLPIERAAAQETFSFAVTTDMRNFAGPGTYNTSSYFRGVMEAVKVRGGGAFMIVPGDLDPPANVAWTIEQVMGAGYMWYPVVGNHELEALENMAWMRSYDYDRNGSGAPPDIVNWGPTGCTQTTYSFDYGNAHFAVLNQYCDSGGDVVTDGNVPDHLYNWLVADLQATNKEHIFVVGHEPAYPQPDADNGRLRHEGDSLDQYPANRDRFWNLLKSEGVTAYLTAHTHNYSAVRIDGVWQLDAGHARGAGDTGAASTFLMIHVNGSEVTFDAYRDVHDGTYDYDDIVHSGTLKGGDTSVTLIPAGGTWKYLDHGTDQGTAWRKTVFDDSAWAAGPAQLGYGDGDEATTVSYGQEPNKKYITTYFRHTFQVLGAGDISSLTLRILHDDGAVVYLNGAEVYRTNMPAGEIDYLTLASTAIGGADENASYSVSVNPGLLVTGANVLAVEVHQANETSSDVSFALELTGMIPRPTPPAAPTKLTATAASSSRIDLAWTDNADNEVGFHMERSSAGVSWTQIGSVGPNTTNYADSGLTPGTAYSYRVQAYNGSGTSVYSDVVHATTEAAGEMYIGDLDGASSASGSKWNAVVEVAVHDETENPLAGATVSGRWSNGTTGASSCVTGVAGRCSMAKKNLRGTVSSVVFTVDQVTLAGRLYSADTNHDPDGDSNGTSIVLAKPR